MASEEVTQKSNFSKKSFVIAQAGAQYFYKGSKNSPIQKFFILVNSPIARYYITQIW